MNAPFITRFAPSPTGNLHLGHAFSAHCAFSAAQRAGGTCLLRIENTDTTRCKTEFEDAIIEDLLWLGLSWPQPVRRQSAYFPDYAVALQKLRSQGLIYRCFKTRREIADQISLAPHDAASGNLYGEKPFFGSPLSDKEEQTLMEQNKNYAWRLNINMCKDYLSDSWNELFFVEDGEGPNGESGSIKATPELFGDVILGRKDTGTSYHMASVHDDALQNISHIVRGVDLFAVTHLHVLLQALFGLPTPVYCHHPLLTDESGKRFAKRDKAKTLKSMRDEGVSANDVRMLIKQYL